MANWIINGKEIEGYFVDHFTRLYSTNQESAEGMNNCLINKSGI